METLILRQWKDGDLEHFVEMNGDPEVMRHFPATLSREESKALFEKLRTAIEARGWGLWAVEVEGVLAGFTGLNVPPYPLPFAPCTEIGWRFRPEFWGRGLATRAAREALRYGFEILKLPEIVSFTTPVNERSWRLMERLGFERDVDGEFDHPVLPEGHPLRRHYLYRLKSGEGNPR